MHALGGHSKEFKLRSASEDIVQTTMTQDPFCFVLVHFVSLISCLLKLGGKSTNKNIMIKPEISFLNNLVVRKGYDFWFQTGRGVTSKFHHLMGVLSQHPQPWCIYL